MMISSLWHVCASTLSTQVSRNSEQSVVIDDNRDRYVRHKNSLKLISFLLTTPTMDVARTIEIKNHNGQELSWDIVDALFEWHLVVRSFASCAENGIAERGRKRNQFLGRSRRQDSHGNRPSDMLQLAEERQFTGAEH